MDVVYEADLMLTDDGDLVLHEDNGLSHEEGDLKSSLGSKLISQIIINRVKTMSPDWFYDGIGADLEQLLGKVNNKETALKGAELIKNALTYDGFIKNDDIFVKPSPIDEFTIMYILAVRVSTSEELLFKVGIALSSGVNIEEM